METIKINTYKYVELSEDSKIIAGISINELLNKKYSKHSATFKLINNDFNFYINGDMAKKAHMLTESELIK